MQRSGGAASFCAVEQLTLPLPGFVSGPEEAPVWAQKFDERAASLSLLGQCAIHPSMAFYPAFEAWLRIQTSMSEASGGVVKELDWKTIRTYRQQAKALSMVFGNRPLSTINDGHLREYARMRAICDGPWTRPCGQNLIRKEMDLAVRILRAAHCWTKELKEAYKSVPKLETEGHRALDDVELARLLQRMQEKKRWEWVLYDAILAIHTTADTSERRNASLEDVDLEMRTFRVGPKASKNKYRNRLIPLESDEAIEAAQWLKQRALSLGAKEPHHKLFPFRLARGKYDPNRAMTVYCLDQAYMLIRKDLEGLEKVTPYDLRHTAITRLAKAGTPIATIMACAGQVSRRMQEHYTTISMLAKREAHRIAWADQRIMPARLPVSLPPKKPCGSVRLASEERREIA